MRSRRSKGEQIADEVLQKFRERALAQTGDMNT